MLYLKQTINHHLTNYRNNNLSKLKRLLQKLKVHLTGANGSEDVKKLCRYAKDVFTNSTEIEELCLIMNSMKKTQQRHRMNKKN